MKKSAVLSPLGLLYGAIVATRNRLYENGVFKSHNLNAPTVSIGNLTVGGTGKTPLVALTARILAVSGKRVCVLTRGYKRADESKRVLVSDGEKILADAKTAGDEPLELARALLDVSVSVVADASRVSAGQWARVNLGATAFVLDDAFQHRQVARDLDIVCVDATDPFGNGKLLPAGILREPLKNMSRADAVVITRANLVDESKIKQIRNEIAEFNKGTKIFACENKIKTLTRLEDFNLQKQREALTIQAFTSSKLPSTTHLAFCALGNAENFFEQLRRENLQIVSAEAFKDHHFYTQRDIDELHREAKERGVEALITTAKDAVKLENLKFELPCLIAENELVFDREKLFWEMIQSLANN